MKSLYVQPKIMSGIRQQFESAVREHGLPSAMRFLNDRVPYRYSAVFRFDGDTLHNLCLVDKQDSAVSECGDQPITNSYCTYVRNSGSRFSMPESLRDARVEGHPKRESIQSYYGIPLYDHAGHMLGTVCHFDASPIRVTNDVASDLDDLAQIISEAAFNPS